ncbi:MAG: hypothetical protein ACFFBC_03970 [Promethearchaeota archaeon]
MKSKLLNRKLLEFKELKKSRKLSVLILISLLVVFQIISVITVIVISDTIRIISTTVIPNGYVSINFDYTQPEDMEVSIPYYINNPGISDLTDIILTIRLHANYTDNSTKETVKQEIFYKSTDLGVCKAWSVLEGYFEGGFTDYNVSAVIDFLNKVDPEEFFWILGDITLEATYFIGLIRFTILNRDFIII